MVPEGWNQRELGDIARVFTGGTPSRSVDAYWNNGTIPWARTTEVQNCLIRRCDIEQRITSEGLANSSAKIAPSGSILIALIGQGKTRGQVALLEDEAAINQNCAAIELSEGHCPAFYFNYLLTRYQKIRNLSNSAGQSNLNGALIKSISVPVPPSKEQFKIAEILSTWDRAINAVEKLIENSERQKKALMRQLLTSRRRLPGFTDPWTEVAIADMGTIVGGGTPESSNSSYWDGDVLWATPTDVTALESRNIGSTAKQISALGLKNSAARLLPRGSLLMCTRATIGDLAIASEPIATNQGFKNLVPNEGCYVDFLYYLFSFNRHIFKRNACGSTFAELSKKDFEKQTFRMPELHEQKRIAQVLNCASDELAFLEGQRAHLEREKTALMQQLLTGKRRIRLGGGNSKEAATG